MSKQKYMYPTLSLSYARQGVASPGKTATDQVSAPPVQVRMYILKWALEQVTARKLDQVAAAHIKLVTVSPK